MTDLSPSALILKDILKPEKVLETHISYVMLTKDHAYKLKKAVDFGFLDFKLLNKRKIFCILEKELNERFSNGIYEEVLKIAKRGDQLVLVPFENTLLTVDYVLKMKRVKDEEFLSYKIEKGLVNNKYMANVGRHIAHLFKSIKTDDILAKENGNFDTIFRNCEENFHQTGEFLGKFINEKEFNFIKNKTYSFLENNKILFERRLTEGYIIDGHGDLRLDHVYEDENGIGLLDCIEFNKRFRFNDAISEIAFLLMELDQKGEVEKSDACLKGFTEIYNDDDSLTLLNFYKCYRAYVRVKIACFMLNELNEGDERYSVELGKLKRLIDLSLYYAINMDKPKVLIYYGVMGSGKSKNSQILQKKFPVFRINTDEFRKDYFNISRLERVYEDYNKGIYSYENSKLIYKMMGEKVQEMTKLKRMAVVDGSFSKKELYLIFASNINTPIYKIMCYADDKTILKRLAKREEKESVSDGRVELYLKQKKSVEDIGADITIDTTYSLEENLKKVIDFLLR